MGRSTRIGRSGLLVVALATTIAGLVGAGVQAQGHNTIHIELDGGGAPGTYDITTSEPCRPDASGPGDWAIDVTDPAAVPASFSIVVNAQDPQWDFLLLNFGEQGAIGSSYQNVGDTQMDGTVDDRGQSATLTLAARDLHSADADGTGVPGGSAVITIECSIIERPFGYTDPTSAPSIATAGDWTGTVTLTAVIDYHKIEPGQGPDPDNAFFSTWTDEHVIQAHATDTFQVVASDPEDLTYGLSLVDLDGSATNAGSTLETLLKSAEKQNSGCTWHQDNGTYKQGSWTANGRTSGLLRFHDDGSYRLDINADTTDPDGVAAPDPELPYRIYEEVSDIAGATCQGEGYDTTITQEPLMTWATEYLGARTVDGTDAHIEGQLDPNDPGSVVAGSQTWTIDAWDRGVTLTAEWHLEHDGPIPLDPR